MVKSHRIPQSYSTNSQEIRTLKQICEKYNNEDDSVIYSIEFNTILEKATTLSLAQNPDLTKDLAYINKTLGNMCYNEKDFEQALTHYNDAANYYSKLEQKSDLAETIQGISDAQFMLDQYAKVLEYNPIVLKYYKEIDEKSKAADSNFELAPDIYILDKVNPIESFEDLTNKLQGKPIYIDRWASWCTPCIEEFKHNKALHNFLKDNNIEIVYLNSDTELDEEKWFDFITDHNLKGNHLRLDSILKADLIDKGIFIPMIPQYMIVNEKGKVLTNKALRPSTDQELYDQIDSLINK